MKTALILLAIAAALCIAGSGDYQEAVAQQDLYCQQVRNGQWPDFNGNYREVCHPTTPSPSDLREG
jgi:hypothetical protein